jgi:hypothetical protein
MALYCEHPREREADMGETVKHIAWAYAAWTLAIVVRLWTMPFFILGWVIGVTIDAFGFGWKAAFDCPVGAWADELHRAHQPRPAQIDASELTPFDDDDDSFDDED